MYQVEAYRRLPTMRVTDLGMTPWQKRGNQEFWKGDNWPADNIRIIEYTR